MDMAIDQPRDDEEPAAIEAPAQRTFFACSDYSAARNGDIRQPKLPAGGIEHHPAAQDEWRICFTGWPWQRHVTSIVSG
jgi:hypothetical protein